MAFSNFYSNFASCRSVNEYQRMADIKPLIVKLIRNCRSVICPDGRTERQKAARGADLAKGPDGRGGNSAFRMR